MQTLPFSEARARLADVLRRVEAGPEPVLISRRGAAAGVLMSFEQYQSLGGAATGFAARLKRWRAEYLAAGHGSAEKDPFEDVRQNETTREFSW
ncbi:MAG TPA: type II toxin-antitoxin system Phd/YefM family antitoxin [Rhodoferax sp.]